jgi:hypothetical protein
VLGQVSGYLQRALLGQAVTYERKRYWPGRGERHVAHPADPRSRRGRMVQGIYTVGHDIDEDHRLRNRSKSAKSN